MPNKRSYKFFLLGVVLVSIGLISCKNNHIREVNEDIVSVLAETEGYVEQAKIPYDAEQVDTVLTKEDIWLGEESFKIMGGEPLPKSFEESDSVTISVNEPIHLLDLVEQLRDMTGLRFSLEELKAKDEVPEDTIIVDYSGNLSGLLDYISHKLSVYWKYRRGEISFYKVETRVFTIYALPVESSMNASLSGTPVSSANGGASTTLQMSTDIKLEVWANIEEGIKQIMGDNGELLVSPTTGTVTVTAPPFTIQKVARYVQELNEKMSRQVAISVKVLQVSVENSDNYGLDLSVIFNQNSRYGFNFVGPFTSASSVGRLSMAVVNSDGKLGKGSEAVIEALSTQGKTALITSTSVTTLNNKVAPVQVTTQQNYVKQTTIEKDDYSSGEGSTSVEMETDTLNYGFTMELLPRILDNGRLILLFTMTLTDLIDLTKFSSDGQEGDGGEDTESSGTESSGSGSTEATVVQLPKMQTRGFIQEIAMRSGATLVLTGFESVSDNLNTSGIGQPRLTILGGQEYTTQKRSVLVILLTPEILVSPLSPETRMENF